MEYQNYSTTTLLVVVATDFFRKETKENALAAAQEKSLFLLEPLGQNGVLNSHSEVNGQAFPTGIRPSISPFKFR